MMCCLFSVEGVILRGFLRFQRVCCALLLKLGKLFSREEASLGIFVKWIDCGGFWID